MKTYIFDEDNSRWLRVIERFLALIRLIVIDLRTHLIVHVIISGRAKTIRIHRRSIVDRLRLLLRWRLLLLLLPSIEEASSSIGEWSDRLLLRWLLH